MKSRATTARFLSRHGFVLLECMLAVFIFAMAALGFGRCVQGLMRAEGYRREEALAQLALGNYWRQVEMGAIPITTDSSEDLQGAWLGMTMAIHPVALQLQNEKNQDLFSLYQISLVLTWTRDGGQQQRQMDFIYYQRTQ